MNNNNHSNRNPEASYISNISYTPLDEAYKIHHINNNPYQNNNPQQYSPKCVFCSHNESLALLNDGGSFRRCMNCRKEFKANILTQAVPNYLLSTSHLKTTH